MPLIRVKLSQTNATGNDVAALNAELLAEKVSERENSSNSTLTMSTRIDCFGDFASISNLGELVDVDSSLLKKACDDYKTMLGNDERLVTNKENFIRATYFPVHDLEAVIAQSRAAGSMYLKVYVGVDNDGEQFMFSAPTNAAGEALANSETLALACVKVPPCPAGKTDQFITDLSV